MKQRPIYLNLFTIQFPIPAIVSFLHRLSGVYLCLMIPILLWVLEDSLHSQARFELLKLNLSSIPMQLMLWATAAALLFHFLAGVRHLLMDVHLGDSLSAGRFSAWTVLFLCVIGILWVGAWIWLR